MKTEDTTMKTDYITSAPTQPYHTYVKFPCEKPEQ